ncbi:unnamed protein product [Vitrella brassicaformis CCMP3155]|uniref:CBS domain-containing protein n=1 Tax=Vitrella brassicaformis (strain CCMP3155) TaxID=1169540 RepID=A0A0G4EU66_VITBC|nr:unnamed protein product [Vitrella brassicaformis CCMP3155]|eukprot:CEM02188.1 unnamed protein product [Vitrella brassicaformis CCMP3155]
MDKRPETLHDLMGTPMGDVVGWLEPQDTCILDKREKLSKCLTELHRRGLRSCVVKDANMFLFFETSATFHIMDMRDVNCYVMDLIRKLEAEKARGSGAAPAEAPPPPAASKKDKDTVTISLTGVTKALQPTDIGGIANYSKKNGPRPLDASETLRDALKAFEDSPRVPVLLNSKLLRIFSAVDFFQILKEGKYLPEIESMSPLKHTDSFPLDVVALNEADTLFKAMRLFESTGYSALPITEGTESPGGRGRTLAVISVRDLASLAIHNGLHPESVFNEPAIEFLTRVRQQDVTGKTGKSRFPYIHVPHDATLQMVVSKLITTRIHRVLLCDQNDNVTGVLSITDVAKRLGRVL